jgi:hypothetical protein
MSAQQQAIHKSITWIKQQQDLQHYRNWICMRDIQAVREKNTKNLTPLLAASRGVFLCGCD